MIILDPVNLNVIRTRSQGRQELDRRQLHRVADADGLGGLFKNDLVEWISAMTYQAAPARGAEHARTAQQMGAHARVGQGPGRSGSAILDIDRKVAETMRCELPDQELPQHRARRQPDPVDRRAGRRRPAGRVEGGAGCNKILGNPSAVPHAGQHPDRRPVRAHRRDALPLQALTIKLKKDVPLGRDQRHHRQAQPMGKVVPNEREISERELTLAAVTGTLTVPVGPYADVVRPKQKMVYVQWVMTSPLGPC